MEHRTTEKLEQQIEKRVGSETNSLDGLSVDSSKGSDKLEEKKYTKQLPIERQRPPLNVINFLNNTWDKKLKRKTL